MPISLALKQRLAALSSAASSPTSSSGVPDNFPKSPSKRRNFFNSSSKWTNPERFSEELDAQDKMQEVMARMIYQAGVDFETRPMVVLNASALPDPREVSYDLLLVRILSYLNLYVEADYTVVFFAAGVHYNPGWNWVWKAYRSLNRKYRKNLKKLFIVHSNFFSKMLFSLAGAMISPKFFRKISYINTLSDLACQVPLTQIDIPPAAYQENLKHEQQIRLPIPTRANVFHVPLAELMGYDGEKGGIPRVVKDAIQFLRETGMHEEGLFRRSPSSALLKQVCDAYDRGHVVSLETFGDPNLAAVLIKKYLRDLPEPIFPESLYTLIGLCPVPSNEPGDVSTVTYIREVLLPELPRCSYILINSVLHTMHEVSLRVALNKMDAHNLAVVLCPNLVSSSSPIRDVMICAVPGGPEMFQSELPSQSPPVSSTEGKTTLGLIIKFCIQHYYEIFDEVLDHSEAVPPKTGVEETASSSSSSPQQTRFSAFLDDEEIDDAILVMPIGPDVPGGTRGNGAAASDWSLSPVPYQPRHPNNLKRRSSAGRSVYTTGGRSNTNGTIGKAKSMISIDKGDVGTVGGKASISIGRGTTKKSAGSGVAAISVTAAGFFAPPSSAPPVPSLPQDSTELSSSNL